MPKRLLPVGSCWCGCGGETRPVSFFLPGHDKVAESAVILVECSGVPEFLERPKYSPSGKNPRAALAEWQGRGGRPR